MELDEYLTRAAATDLRADVRDVAIPLLGLAGEVGSLVAEYKKHLRADTPYEGFIEEAREDLGDLLWYVAALARTLGLSLDDVAEQNLRKISAAWGEQLPPASIYDQGFPAEQRLPRSFTIRFESCERDGLHHVAMYLGDNALGDPLNDNAYVEDYYRFHDAFHLACAAVLGWSPILRQLLRRKRKQRNDIDRVEDGARARALEEGLSAYVFSIAGRFNYFRDVERVDWELLKTVRRMTQHLEVADQPPVAWQRTILQAYDVWRALADHDGGVVEGNLDARNLKFVYP